MFRRINRFSYFLNNLALPLPILLAAVIVSLMAMNPNLETIPSVFGFVISSLLIGLGIYLFIGNVAGRLKDIGKPPIYGLWLLVPMVSIYWGLLLYFKAGDKGSNEYGKAPEYEPYFAIKTLAAISCFTIALVSYQYAKDFTKPLGRQYLTSMEDVAIELNNQISEEQKSVATRDLTREIEDEKALSENTSWHIERQKKSPCEANSTYKLAKLLHKREYYDQVEKLYERFSVQCGEFLELRWLAYRAAKDQDDFAQAERLVSAMIQDYPNDKDYWGWRGMLYETYKMDDKAVRDFEQVITLSPKIARIPINLVDAYARLGKFCDAAKSLDRYLKTREIQDNFLSSRLLKLKDQCKSQQTTH